MKREAGLRSPLKQKKKKEECKVMYVCFFKYFCTEPFSIMFVLEAVAIR